MQNHSSPLRASQGQANRLISSPAHPCKLGLHTLLLCLMQACAGSDMDGTSLGAKERSNAPPPSTSLIKEIALNESGEEQPERMQGQLLGGMQSPQGTTQSMGSSAGSISPRQERWFSGPRVDMKGNKQSFIEIFHIPRGKEYIDYKVVNKKTGGNSGYTIRYVTGQSKADIESLKNANSATSFEAALKANALGAADVSASGRIAHDRKAGKNRAQSENHSHAAIVVRGEVSNSTLKTGRLILETQICLAPINPAKPAPRPTSSSKATPVSPSKDDKQHVDKDDNASEGSVLPDEEEATERLSYLSGRRSSFDPGIPIEEAFPLLLKKLNDAKCRLSEQESIDLLTTCTAYGEHNARDIKGKEAVIVIGNTGAGKSSFVNYLAGCEMVFKGKKKKDGKMSKKKHLVVKPKAEGGCLDEIMPIGHDKKSKTFMPHIETTAQQITYCDCPGFLDNRGAEINIANAVNIRKAFSQAKGVKVIILINYCSLKADRGRGLTDMINICSHLFGSTQNIEKYKDSILLGISQVSPYDPEFDGDEFKEWLTEDTPEIMKVLAERVFFFDPIDREIDGAWKRAECLQQITKLKPITNPGNIFKTVLTDSDEQALLKIANSLNATIKDLLAKGETKGAAKKHSYLVRLSAIDHSSVERLLSQATQEIQYYYTSQVSAFKEACAFHRFEEAAKLLNLLKASESHFGKEILRYESAKLDKFYKDSEARYQEQQERDKKYAEAIEKAAKAEAVAEKAKGRIEELIKLLAEQEEATKKQMKEQAERFEGLIASLHKDLDAERAKYNQQKADFKKDFDSRMKQKEEELDRARQTNEETLKKDLEKQLADMKSNYKAELAAKEEAQKAKEEAQKKKERALQKELSEQQKVLQEQLLRIEKQRDLQKEELRKALKEASKAFESCYRQAQPSLFSRGDAAAQYNLAGMYENGLGVVKDDKAAVVWYRKAADQGHARAQNKLGVMYEEGRGVVKDDKQAVAWYTKVE